MPERPLVAVHQPNFLPWLGFFDKIARADTFVLLDSAQYPRRSAGSWINRVRVRVGGSAGWLTVPVRRPHGVLQRIDEVEVDETRPWRETLLGTIQANYARARAFDEVYPVVKDALCWDSSSLAEINIRALGLLTDRLGLGQTVVVRASELEVEGRATQLLVNLVKAVGGSAYLSGDGASGYQEDELFADAGLELVMQRFAHPTYEQDRPHEPGLSVIDAAMHLGWEGAAALLTAD